MKTTLIFLLASSWPVFSHSQTPNPVASAQILIQGESLLEQHADSAALVCAQNALSLIRPNTNLKLESNAYHLLGRAQWRLGNHEEAVAPLQKALALRRRVKNDSLTLTSLVTLSSVMGDREEPQLDSALLYLSEAQGTAEKLRDTLNLAKIHTNAANVLFLEEEYEEALAKNHLAEKLLEGQPFAREKGVNYYGMANAQLSLYVEKGKASGLQEAKASYERAIQLFQQAGERAFEAHARNALGSAALYSDDFPKARNELKKSLDLSEKLQDSIGLLNTYYNLAMLAEMENKPSEAARALKKLSSLLEQSGSANDYVFVREQFSNSDVKISKTLLDNKISIITEKQKNERSRQIMLVGFSVLGTLTFGGAFYFRQKIGAKQALMEQKEKLHLKEVDNLLKEKEIEFVRARLEGEQIGRQRIARKIHDGVGGLLISAKWNLESVLEELSGKEKKVISRLNDNIRFQDESYQELRRVVYELERENVPWWEDLQRFCQRLDGNKKASIRFYTYNLDENVGGPLGEETRLITQELITNALKHANASEIIVQINRIDNILSIVVEDNGMGFDSADAVSSAGAGLRSIEERASQLSGNVSFETGKGTGTSVFVDIPLKSSNMLENSSFLYASN